MFRLYRGTSIKFLFIRRDFYTNRRLILAPIAVSRFIFFSCVFCLMINYFPHFGKGIGKYLDCAVPDNLVGTVSRLRGGIRRYIQGGPTSPPDIFGMSPKYVFQLQEMMPWTKISRGFHEKLFPKYLLFKKRDSNLIMSYFFSKI